MRLKQLFFYLFISFIIQLTAQELPDLSDSVIIYKYANSNYYQLVKPIDSHETLYFNDSTVLAKGKFLKGNRNGNWSVFYPTGIIKTFGYITDSSFYGKWKFYYPNGVQKAKGKFKFTADDKDSSLLVLKMSGKWKFWNENGVLISKSYYSPYRINETSKYGKYKEKYASGQTKITGEYYKGAKIGTWTHYYENGRKRLVAYYTYKSDKNKVIDYPIGIWFYKDQNGKIIKKEIYKNGKLDQTVTFD